MPTKRARVPLPHELIALESRQLDELLHLGAHRLRNVVPHLIITTTTTPTVTTIAYAPFDMDSGHTSGNGLLAWSGH
jgi:hypothetical protein